MDLAQRLFSPSTMEWDLRFPLVHPSNSPFIKKEKKRNYPPHRPRAAPLCFSCPGLADGSTLGSRRSESSATLSAPLYQPGVRPRNTYPPLASSWSRKCFWEVRIQRGRAKNTYTLMNVRADGIYMRALACFVPKRSRGNSTVSADGVQTKLSNCVILQHRGDTVVGSSFFIYKLEIKPR